MPKTLANLKRHDLRYNGRETAIVGRNRAKQSLGDMPNSFPSLWNLNGGYRS